MKAAVFSGTVPELQVSLRGRLPVSLDHVRTSSVLLFLNHSQPANQEAASRYTSLCRLAHSSQVNSAARHRPLFRR